MRFHCQSCGAKYQIADEKVAGKTVRMKCRKCATLIQVRARETPAGIEAEHVTGPPSVRPGAPPSSHRAPSQHPAPPSSRAPSPSQRGLPRPPAPRPIGPRGGAPPRPRGSGPGVPAPPSSSRGLPPRRAPAPSAPGSIPRAAPSVPRASAPASSAPAAPPSSSSGIFDEGTAAMSQPGASSPSGPSSAGATAPESSGPAVAQDANWFVGIGGEPVGPVGHHFLQQQIDAGKVTAKSLVWREGMANWKPLNEFEPLRALLAAKKAPLAPPAAAASAPVALTRKKEAAALSTALMSEDDRARAESATAAAPAAEASAPQASAPEASAPDAAKPSAPGPTEPSSPGDPAEPAAAEPSAPSQPERSQPGGESAGVEPPAARGGDRPGSLPPSSSDLLAAGVPPSRTKRGMHPMAWAFIAMAAAFGGVSAWFLFGQSESQDGAEVAMGTAQPSPTGKAVAETGGPGASEDPKPSTNDGSESGEETDEGADTSGGSVGTPGGVRPSSSGSDDDEESGSEPDEKKPPKPCDPDDPFCSPGVDGPSTKGSDSSGSAGDGQGLSQSQLQSTVSRYRGSLTRRCRPLVTEGSAKVAATVRVGPSGAVQSVSTSGGNGVPGLAGCVASRIRNWRFPTSGGTSTFSVSFNFL